MKQRPFKKLYCDWRKRIFVELKGARLAVWLYHYMRSNKEDQAWPSISGVARETGLHRDTVIEARKYLFSTGWLVKIEDAKFRTRRVAATFPNERQSEIPTSEDEKPVGNSDQGQSEIPDAGKFRHEVDTSSEVAPKEVDHTDAVRRPDSELRPMSGKDSASRRKRKTEKLTTNLQEKIRGAGNCFRDWMKTCERKKWGNPFGAEEREAFAAIGYKPDLNSELLTTDFVDAVVDVYEKKRSKNYTSGNLCSAVIDQCKELIDSGEPAYYAPEFKEHRDRLREDERKAERGQAAAANA